jgi:hypothetical protein
MHQKKQLSDHQKLQYFKSIRLHNLCIPHKLIFRLFLYILMLKKMFKNTQVI